MVSESSMRSANGFSGRRNQPGPRDIDTSQDVLANQEDEAEVYSNTRMLQDPTGRLCELSFYKVVCAKRQ